MDRRSEPRDAFSVSTPSARWQESSGDKARQKLRSACDFCHAAKVKCSGEPICARCQNQDLPCSYSYAMRAGKPKGSRNKKTLEKQARLRQDYAARSLHNDWQTTAMDLDTSPWADSTTTAGIDLSCFSDELNGASNPFQRSVLTGGESQCVSGQDCSITPQENLFTHVDPFLLAGESPPFEPFTGFDNAPSGNGACNTSARPVQDEFASPEPCNCFENQMTNLNYLHSLYRKACPQNSSSASSSCRLDICVQRINAALASCRTFLRCMHCRKDSFSVLLTASSFQLVMRLFEYIVAQQSSTPDSEVNTNGAPKNGDTNGQILCRLGEYEVSQEEEMAIRRFVVRRALQKGEETLATLKNLTEQQARSSPKAGSPVNSSSRSNSLPSPSSMVSPILTETTHKYGATGVADTSMEGDMREGACPETGFIDLSGADMVYLRQIICRSEAILELFMRTVSRDLYI